VLRLGTIPEGFDADRAAMAFDAPDLPVPKIVAIGHAFNVGYAISERHYGRFLEDVGAEESPRSAPMLRRLLGALRTIEERPATLSPFASETYALSWGFVASVVTASPISMYRPAFCSLISCRRSAGEVTGAHVASDSVSST
jgi:hypothetical protein